MTNRRREDPGALPTEPSPQDIRRQLVEIYTVTREFLSTQSDDYTTTGKVAHEVVVMTNSTSKTVYLHDGNNNTPVPEDGQKVTIKRTDAQVTADGGDFNIDGAGTHVLSVAKHARTFEFVADTGEWVVFSAFTP